MLICEYKNQLYFLISFAAMKNLIKYFLQKILGFKNYLFIFSVFKIKTLRIDKKEKDFFHFLNLIPENAVLLDIGANLGIMTVHLARKVKNGFVFAFEPMPENLNILNRISSHYNLKNVKIFDFALGEKNEQIKMIMPVISSVKMQGLSHVLHSEISEFNDGTIFSVECKRLDDIEEIQNTKKISAIKIDVENFEYFVLKGGEKIIAGNKPLIYIELWENENRKKCFDFFYRLNYSIHVVESGKLMRFDSAKHKNQNFIILP